MSTKDPLILRNEFTGKVLSHDYSKGPLLLLAGPGTGKTFSLLETIKKQLVSGRQLKDFFVTTLTNAAVGDFEEEAKIALSADFENVSTLHFRAKGIVHHNVHKVGLNPSFLVLTKREKKYILQEIKEILIGKKIGARKVDVFLEKYEEELANNKPISTCDFVSVYQELKKFYNVIDWYDVSYLACKILNENVDVIQEESSKQSFILVDEYQDLNKADQDIIRLISKYSQLLVVGDDDQSIYGGRFADPSGIVNFPSFYEETESINLPVCSRCPTLIIKASKNLIDKNDKSKRVAKSELIALPDTDKKADGGYIVSVGLRSAKEEAIFLGEAIKSIIQRDSGRAKDIKVLCSYRSLGLELMEAIFENNHDIPIEDRLTEEEENTPVIIVRYLVRFLEDHGDNLALRMFLEMFLKISLTFKLVENGENLWVTLNKSIGKKEFTKVTTILDKFIKTVYSSEGKSIDEKLVVFSQEYPKLTEAIVQMPKFKIGSEENNEEEKRLIELAPAQGVQFMTMHSSKGLDAKYVFIPFMEEEAKLPAKTIEEQRRLLYVAITRAKVAVVISWAFSRQSVSRHKAGGGGFMRRHRSNFIKECSIISDTPMQHILSRLGQLGNK